jgi:hypothetical protein
MVRSASSRVSNHQALLLHPSRRGEGAAPQDEAESRDYTFSNGTLMLLRFSSHAGTGRFFERMKSGLNSFD